MNRFAMTALFPALELDPPDFLLREYGKRAYPLLARELKEVAPCHTLVLDFADVSVMDASFTEEAVLRLALDLAVGAYGDRFLMLERVSPATLDNIEATIAWRRAKVALPVREGKHVRVAGHIEPNLLEVWALAIAAGTLTARELANHLQLEINTASMRLRKLYDARLLNRKEDISVNGRQHVYQPPD